METHTTGPSGIVQIHYISLFHRRYHMVGQNIVQTKTEHQNGEKYDFIDFYHVGDRQAGLSNSETAEDRDISCLGCLFSMSTASESLQTSNK